ncbi:MAG: GNAT family N-acetyltransferase [Hyphomicrobiaceae bacterium]
MARVVTRRPAKIYGRVGELQVRLATTGTDVKRAQRLRYEVFYNEMSANPSFLAQMRQRDEDEFDAICEHLLVVDTAADAAARMRGGRRAPVVGTYRVLRQDVADRNFGFYTEREYDIRPLIQRRSDLKFMELGRSCVLKPYRSKRSVELLWHGLWTYVREHKVDVMVGCASFPGTDPSAHAAALSFLHHNALAPEEWRCRAHEHLFQRMDLVDKADIDAKAALKSIPPLIKGYLRLGAYVGEGAVIDRQFGTTDVLIILPVSKIDPRYFGHFGAPDEVKSRIAECV